MLEDIARGNGTKFPEKVDLSSGKKDGGKVGEVETLACSKQDFSPRLRSFRSDETSVIFFAV